jgi:hypothetical protein
MTRLNRGDIMASITNPRGGEKKPIVFKTVCYNDKGENDEKRKKKFSYEEACIVINFIGERVSSYRLKFKRGGQLYNPLKEGGSYGLKAVDKTTGEPMFKLREVNEKAFTNYLKFLQTRYDSHLLAAEREA